MASNHSKVVTIALENTPGTLGEATRAIAQENVNILAIECSSLGDIGFARFVTDQPERAEKVLRDKGYTITTGEIVEADLPNRPGEIARVCEALAQANVNIEGLWAGPITGNAGKIVLRVDNVSEARRIVQAKATPTLAR